MKVAIIGVGGVGGFYGARLAKHYASGNLAEVAFMARGLHLERIREQGLRLITPEGEWVARPVMATDDPEALGHLDLAIFCVKGYDLEGAALSLKGNFSDGSVVLPLLNGVANAEILKSLLPQTRVLNGCVYLSAHVEAPGAVRHVGGPGKLFFGPEEGDSGPYREIEVLLKEAGIQAELEENIKEVVWEKYIFISPLAGVTSLRREPIGAVMARPESRDLVRRLMEEVARVAHARGVHLPGDIVEVSLAKAAAFPYETKTSLQLDFEKGRKTELETFTGYMVRAAQESGVPVPLHQEIYDTLKAI